MLFAKIIAAAGTAAETGGGGLFAEGNTASSTLITFLLGLGIVFIGLIALIAIIKIMGAIMSRTGKKKQNATEPAPAPVKAAVPEGDLGEIKAAVAAAVATVMGESVSGIRIVSFKRVD